MIALADDLETGENQTSSLKKAKLSTNTTTRSETKAPATERLSSGTSSTKTASGQRSSLSGEGTASRISVALGQAMQSLANYWVKRRQARKQRREDKLALNQLLQLDDSLLKDMGITRSELLAAHRGSLPFDAIVKRKIVTNRDNNLNTTNLR